MTSLSKVTLVRVNALDRKRIDDLASSGPLTVCFLAGSFARYAELREQLPAGWSMPVPGPALNAAAERLRDAVINLDTQARPAALSRSAWDASLLAERGPLTSTLMLNLARLVVFVEWVARPGRHLVVVDDHEFGRLLAREARGRGWDAGWLTSGFAFDLQERAFAGREVVSRALDGARRRASAIRRFLTRKAQLAWWRRQRPLRLDELRQADVLLAVWGRAHTFPQGGQLIEEFNFGHLPDLLRKAGFAVAYLAYPLTYVSPFHAIVANAVAAQEPVALVEDFIPWWAIIPAAIAGWRLPHHVGQLRVLGIDATQVLRLEARRDRRLSVSVEANLLAYVGDGLARRGIRPKTLVHLYEAQPWEKMLTHGVRRHLASTRIVGVQHAPFARNYLSFFPSRESLAEAAIPDLLLTSGEAYKQWFQAAGFAADRVGVVGALRYGNAAHEESQRGRAVLCCTGIEIDEAIELATKAAIAVQGTGIPLIINFHPVTDETFRATVRDRVHEAVQGSAQITFSPEPMRKLLEHAGTVLYMSSAACFEAVLARRSAIYVTRDVALDYDKLPDDVALRCNSLDALRDMLRVDSAQAARQSAAALRRWLAPVADIATLRQLLSPAAGVQTACVGERASDLDEPVERVIPGKAGMPAN
jgi:hypothetical protein